MDLESLVSLEDRLAEELEEFAEVDGHDIGSGEMNIFILTDNPKKAFEMSRSVILETSLSGSIRAAYREVTGSTFTILWPTTLKEFVVK